MKTNHLWGQVSVFHSFFIFLFIFLVQNSAYFIPVIALLKLTKYLMEKKEMPLKVMD